MNLRDPKLWIGLVTATAVLTFGIVDTARVSPGPVATVHGRVSDLEDGQNCKACHGGFRTEMAEACLECHEPIGNQMEASEGLHGLLAAEQGMRCALCHSDHHGANFAMVNDLSFALAGIPDVQAFDHATIGFEMAGAHLELDCAECHEHIDSAPLPEGVQRYGGLEAACATCHEDPHQGALGISCTDCHVQEEFTQVHATGHDDVLALVGGHAQLDCRACHAHDTPHSLELARNRRRRPDPRGCVDCHESPHAEALDAAVATRTRLAEKESCVACHGTAHESFQEAEETVTPKLHAATGFALEEPHGELGCAECHGEPALDFSERFLGRQARDCAACHGDPHGGQFENSEHATQSCVSCHADTHFLPTTFGEEQHAQTALPLEHSHLNVACTACHVSPAGEPQVFHGTAARCETCHADAHAGEFQAPAQDLQPLVAGECARCHDARAFNKVDRLGFDHGFWTGYPLKGAHGQAQCEACHTPAEQRDDLGRRFGRVADVHGPLEPGTTRACAECHTDPHAGAFQAANLPDTLEGRSGCVRCHGEDSFRNLPHGFDHGLWTGFVLDGEHASASCASCHTPLRRPEPNGRSWMPALGSSCADCHADPHGAQFARGGESDCARCHTTEGSFELDAFDHSRTRFPLDEAHQAVACSACHEPEPFQLQTGTVDLVRYRPVGRLCVDCHANPTGGALRRKRGKR